MTLCISVCFFIMNTLTLAIYKFSELKILFVTPYTYKKYLKWLKIGKRKKKREKPLPYTGTNNRNIRQE